MKNKNFSKPGLYLCVLENLLFQKYSQILLTQNFYYVVSENTNTWNEIIKFNVLRKRWNGK